MILLAIIAILIAVVVPILKTALPKDLELPKFISGWDIKKSLISFVAGIAFILINMSMFYSEAGMQYLVVSPGGKKSAIMTEGFTFITPLSKIYTWQKFIDVKVLTPKDKEEMSAESIAEIEGLMNPIGVRFIDQVTAHAVVSIRFQLPQDPESFIKLAVEFRSMTNLVNNTLKPTVGEQMENTAYMYAAQDYISGSAQSFKQTFEEMLKGGTYKVSKIEIRDTVFNDVANKKMGIRAVKTNYLVKKVLRNGIPVRIDHDITRNNITVSQVIVDGVILNKDFQKRLVAQRNESAKRQLEQQKIKTAKDAQARIIAEGERDKAKERVSKEKEAVSILIAIETKLKQEKTNRELAEIALQTDKLKAKSKKVLADAQAYQNRQLVSAGLTPQERAKIEKETAIGVAAQVAKIKFPSTMIIGGNKNGGTPLESLIGAAMAKQLNQ